MQRFQTPKMISSMSIQSSKKTNKQSRAVSFWGSYIIVLVNGNTVYCGGVHIKVLIIDGFFKPIIDPN